MDILATSSIDDTGDMELSQGLSAAMQYNSKRDKDELSRPITPFLKCEESRIVRMFGLFAVSQATRDLNRYQHGSIDVVALTETWYGTCREQHLKTLEHHIKMYPKMTQLVKAFYKKYLIQQNARKTL
jgi:hypothetical protein